MVPRKVGLPAIALLVLLCALWGLQQVAIKQSLAGGLPPFFQAVTRSGLAAVLIALWIVARQGGGALRAMVATPEIRWQGVLVALAFAGEFLTLYPGLRLTTASRGVLFLYTAPFFTALGAHWLLPGERLGRRQAVGLLVAFGGVAIAFAQGLAEPGGSVRGDVLCAAAGALWGANTVLVRALPALRSLPAAQLVLFQLGGSVPFLAVAAVVAGEMGGVPDATALAWVAWLYQTVVVAFASYLAWFWLLTKYPATQIAGFTFLTPLFGILAGALLLGEQVGVGLLAGLAAVAIGLRLLRPSDG